jgi:hypothetical protein
MLTDHIVDCSNDIHAQEEQYIILDKIAPPPHQDLYLRNARARRLAFIRTLVYTG